MKTKSNMTEKEIKKKLFFNQDTLTYTVENGNTVTSLALNCHYPEHTLIHYKIINL